MAISTEERRIVTVLFADMAGSTSLGEELDPEEMRRLLTRYYAIARDGVIQHGGTVEKFIGDAVMAVFGLPTAHGDDPDRAVAAALAIREKVREDAELNERLAIRFGVSTGEVVASRDQSAGDFLVTGDATNVAARLQQAADPWGILVSERTARAAATGFDFGVEVKVDAKGKSAPVVAREVLGRRKAKTQRPTSMPLIGRENDFAQLQLAARRAFSEKRPWMVSIIAPAGTGKTRLAEELFDWLPSLAPNAVVAMAQCLPYGQQLTYWPMRQVLFNLMGHSPDAMPSDIRREIEAWLAGLDAENPERDSRLLAATVGEMGTEGFDKDQLFAAWRRTLETVARRNPLVVVFEDLHWSSDSLLDLAEFVMQPRGEAGVLMLVLARPELLDRRPTWGGGKLNHQAIALEPLGSQAVSDLVRHLLDADAPEVIQLVAERSEGNPFYAVELVRSYMERGSLERLPDTVQATVLARLDLLPPEERRCLQIASVFGRSFRAAGVAALQGGSVTSVQRLCEQLADRDLIRPADRDSYTFRHILIQEVAYSTLPRSERARLHSTAASWVESMSQGREVVVAEILAFHYREAAVLSTAVDPGSQATRQTQQNAARWLLIAADVAAGAGATAEAAGHIRASFDYVDKDQLPRLHERIGDLTAGDTGIDEYRMALEGYERQQSPVEDQLRALAGMLMVATRWQGSVGDRPSEQWLSDLRNRGRGLLERTRDPRSTARFLAADAFYPFWIQSLRDASQAELDEARVSAERAIDIAREIDDPELESAALDALAGVAQARNEWPASLAISRRRIEFEDRLGLYERLDAHSMVAWMAVLIGDLATAERDSAEMVTHLLPGQAPYPAVHLLAWRTLTLTLLGRWDEAASMFWRELEAWHDAGSHAAGYGIRGFLCMIDVGRARRDVRLESTARDAITSILRRYPQDNYLQRTQSYLKGRADFASEDAIGEGHIPPEWYERRLNLANDMREAVPGDLLAMGLRATVQNRLPLLEAQVRRAIGLAHREPDEMARAIEIWERCGAIPSVGRARAERGAILRDAAEIEAGLAILKKLGDIDYVDRFSVRF